MVKKLDRLYSRAVFLGYRRGISLQNTNQALLRVEGVKTRKDAKWYLGKRVAYAYRGRKADKEKGVSKSRSIQGKVIAVHGDNGVVRARFHHNLPGQAMGRLVKVMLYPFRPSN
jgi:large subunit ribosomal protein L35Ae